MKINREVKYEYKLYFTRVVSIEVDDDFDYEDSRDWKSEELDDLFDEEIARVSEGISFEYPEDTCYDVETLTEWVDDED